MNRILIALTVSFAWNAAASAETARFVCDNKVTGGEPDNVEIDFGRNTALLFYKNDKGDAFEPEEKSSQAKITATTSAGPTFSMARSTRWIARLVY